MHLPAGQGSVVQGAVSYFTANLGVTCVTNLGSAQCRSTAKPRHQNCAVAVNPLQLRERAQAARPFAFLCS